MADGYWLRLLGLMGLRADEFEPLLIPRCRSVHTFGMKAPIDLVWLGETSDGPKAIGVVEGLSPRRCARAPNGGPPRRRVSALELATGDAQRLGLRPGATVGL